MKKKVESMGQPGDFMSVNIVITAIVWNTVAASCWLYVVWQSNTYSEWSELLVKTTEHDTTAPDVPGWLWLEDYDENEKISRYFYRILYFILSALALHLPLVVVITASFNAWEFAVDLLIPAAYFCVFLLLQAKLHLGDGSNTSWQFRKSLSFWVAYGITLPFIMGAFNSLSQRRDEMYSVNTSVLCISVAGMALGSDYMKAAYDEDRTDQTRVLMEPYYSGYSSFAWFYNFILVGCIAAMPGNGFSPGPFSNTHSVAGFCLALELLIPIVVWSFPINQECAECVF